MENRDILRSKDFLFIIGSPRSGTTMLQILIANHPQVASTVEQTLFTHYVPQWLETWASEVANIDERGWKLGLPILWKEEELTDFLREFLRRAYEKILALKPDATHVLDKHPGYSQHVRTIKRFLPRARFIHMIRDGRDVACSMMAVHKKMGFAPAELASAAAKWRKFVRAARTASEFGADYLEVRYEDFLAQREAAYARVLEFCGLEAKREWITEVMAANTFEKMRDSGASPDSRTKLSEKRYHRGTAGGWRGDFSAWDRYEFDRLAGDLLRELGYAEPEWWAESGSDRFFQPLRRRWAKRAPLVSSAWKNAQAALLGTHRRHL
jgi:hypothetical protein